MEEINKIDHDEVKSRVPTVSGSSFLYLLVLVLMLIVPYLITFKEGKMLSTFEYYGITSIFEILVVAVPAVIYLFIWRMDFRSAIRLNPIRVSEFFLVIGMAVFGYGVVLVLNLLWVWLISHIGPPPSPPVLPVYNGKDLCLALVAAGVVPALVEEFLFRGVILRGFERLGSIKAILLTGTLFGMLHLNLVSLPSLILVGILITYVVYRTNSIWAGVTYHFVNNAIAVFLIYIQGIAMRFYGEIGNEVPEISEFTSIEWIIALVVWGIIGLFCLALFILCAIIFHKITKKKTQALNAQRKVGSTRSNLLQMLPLFFAILIFIYIIASQILEMI